MARTNRRTLYIAAESSWVTDPSANGSGYLPVPANNLGDLQDQRTILETRYANGQDAPTQSVLGGDGCSFSFEMPLYGLSSAAGSGTNASTVTDDCWDVLLNSLFGTYTGLAGTGFSAITSTSDITATTDVGGVGDLLPIYEASIPTAIPRTQWVQVFADSAGDYTSVGPALQQIVTTSAIAYGTKRWRAPIGSGPTLAAVYVDDTVGTYTCLGGKITSLSINAPYNAIAMASITITFDRYSEDAAAKTSLPTALIAPPTTPIVGLRSPVAFNGSYVDCSGVSIDFGVETQAVNSTAAINGRSDHENIAIRPVCTITPQRTNAIRNLKRNLTSGQLLVQLGGGVLSSGVLNTWAMAFSLAEVRDASDQDDGGLARSSVAAHAIYPGSSNGGVFVAVHRG